MRCLCGLCARQQVPGFMPLTHFYMHAREGGDEAGLEEQPDELPGGQQQQGVQGPGAQRQGSEEPLVGAQRSRSVTPEPGTGTGTQGDGEEGEEDEQEVGRGTPGVRVVDNERLKRRVWGALSCGESVELAKAVPYLDEMKRRAVAAGGGELAKAAEGGGEGGADGRAEAAGGGEGGGGPRGRRVWVYHFSEFRQPPWRMYGTWRAARVVSYVEETGEHEVSVAVLRCMVCGSWGQGGVRVTGGGPGREQDSGAANGKRGKVRLLRSTVVCRERVPWELPRLIFMVAL